jgi:zinc transport system substrate-binding protein
MLALADAVAWFGIGVPFEETWAPRIATNHPGLAIVDTRDDISFPPAPANGGRRNPHIWLSPRLVLRQSETIRDALSELMPDHAAQFAAGQAAFATDLEALDAELTARFAGVQNRRFMIYHPALYYFAQDYGLEQIAIEIDGQEPGPASLARIIDEARAADIHVIFVQQEFSQSAAEAVARAIDGEVVTLAPLAENMLENTRSIAEALLRVVQ